jgi:hypothetical protein
MQQRLAEVSVSPAAQRAGLCLQARPAHARGAYDPLDLQRTGMPMKRRSARWLDPTKSNALAVIALKTSGPLVDFQNLFAWIRLVWFAKTFL